MAAEYNFDDAYGMRPNPRTSYPQPFPTSRQEWLESNSEPPSEPCALLPAVCAPTIHQTTHHMVLTPSPHYTFSQRQGFSQLPHNRNSAVYPESSQRTSIDEPPHLARLHSSSKHLETSVMPIITTGYSNPNQMDFREHALQRSRTTSAHSNSPRMNPYSQVQRGRHSSSPSAPILSSGNSSLRQPSPQCLSEDERIMHSMMFELNMPSPTFSLSSSSSTSPTTPFFALRPSMSTLHSRTLEPIVDPDNRDTLYSFIESGGPYRLTDDKNAHTVVDHNRERPPSNDPQDQWYHQSSIVDNNVDRRGTQASRSDSSTSSSSRYSSESESSPTRSSFPNGLGASRHSPTSTSASSAGGPTRKNKMHQCSICKKSFPRPSGLSTHMNSHSGNRPYHCTVDGCNKAFAVRSNAKRHLRIHGVAPMPADRLPPKTSFKIGFDEPFVAQTQDPDVSIPSLKWVDQEGGLTTQSSMDSLDSRSTSRSSDAVKVKERLSPSPTPAMFPSGSEYPPRHASNGARRYDQNEPW